MNTYYDLLQQIKQYGTFIYTGNREYDLALLMEEVRSLKSNGLFSAKEYSQAMAIILKEKNQLN
ncbi:YqgQ family protein [Alkalicoccobacillus plakortidis]|uniref:YqgQ family protein n=1 Tax=Alkalicoccobacillus plakortidis TaxID=444060 RepID=A0ABT0XPG7_9BACI|nr:YqgQ family protein [Alkalicoccobacillus plakortidis]MCM2677795.1 YqgQ family protein [Alkalicoccobacillus plakortidis]